VQPDVLVDKVRELYNYALVFMHRQCGLQQSL
jgi:hypothetical protein